ncbi:MAG: NitT/TauT family transport system substrate-binding protein [Cycloclasticus sp.]|jgi:NitT/TauT family transport system substrate-binding protein
MYPDQISFKMVKLHLINSFQMFYSSIKNLCLLYFFITILGFSSVSFSAEKPSIKVSVLKFGTVNWTLETIKRNGLDKQNGFELVIQPLASIQASNIALQANATDIIVSDWSWVARQRGGVSNYSFAPYSSATGAVIVPEHSSIRSIQDLAGKRLGIAGGGLDKSWLLLRALALKEGMDLDKDVDKVFGAPPLLNNLVLRGKIDALINFWHYNAHLKSIGYRELITTHNIIHRLGIKRTVPILGYVFSEAWGKKNATTLNKFLVASRQASELLCQSDDQWAAVLPLTRSKDSATQILLRKSYCEGRITNFTAADRDAISRIYSILAETGGKKLVGSTKQLDTNLFWNDGFE